LVNGGTLPEEGIKLRKRALHRLKVIEAVTDRRLSPFQALAVFIL